VIVLGGGRDNRSQMTQPKKREEKGLTSREGGVGKGSYLYTCGILQGGGGISVRSCSIVNGKKIPCGCQ